MYGVLTSHADAEKTYIYTYDDWGNITSIVYESASEEKTDLSTLTSTTMTYDESNRMLTYNGEEVLYDEDGNMVYGPLDGEMVTFTYDCRNRLICAGETTYQYDAEDIRIAVETPEYREEYVTDSVSTLSRVLVVERTYKNTGDIPTTSIGTAAELITTGTAVNIAENTTYYYGDGLLYEKNTTQGLMVYHYDHLGSTKVITDTNGSVIASFSYGTYGELLTDTTEYDITLRFLYNGELGVITDDNSLCYMRSRYYNPEIKRFINQDILTGNIGNNKSLNRYSYVEGNPVSYTDPFGLSPYKQKNGIIHAGLDLLGCIPGPIGFVSDMVNAGIYLLEGNEYEAAECVAFSLVGCEASAKAAKYTVKLGRYGDVAQGVVELVDVGGHASAIVFAAHDVGTYTNVLLEKYLVNGESVTWGTVGEVAILALGGTQLGATAYYTSKIPDTLDDAAKAITTNPTDPIEIKFADSDPYVVDEALKGYELSVGETSYA